MMNSDHAPRIVRGVSPIPGLKPGAGGSIHHGTPGFNPELMTVRKTF
ncbi:hypothetical protein [Dyadobacter bucti]|nr:hypothetical protein [Dyadobacter bucti]